MKKYKLLDLMIEDSKIQNQLYKPTFFPKDVVNE